MLFLLNDLAGQLGSEMKNFLTPLLNRPYQTFDGKELYPTPIDKAAAILESIVKNHPFTDGNKRTRYVLARLLLMSEQLDIKANQEQKYQLVISISKGELSFDQIKNWLEKNTR